MAQLGSLWVDCLLGMRCPDIEDFDSLLISFAIQSLY